MSSQGTSLSKGEVIWDPRGYPIQPEAIASNPVLDGRFRSLESDYWASAAVRLCQRRETGWAPFSRMELSIGTDNPRGPEMATAAFWQLVKDGHLVRTSGRALRFTGQFVNTCFEAAPAPLLVCPPYSSPC